MEEKLILYIEHSAQVPCQGSVKHCSGALQSESRVVVLVPHSTQSLRNTQIQAS